MRRLSSRTQASPTHTAQTTSTQGGILSELNHHHLTYAISHPLCTTTRRQALELYLFALQQLAYPSQLSSLFPEDPSAAAVVDKMVHVQAALRAMFK